jgi:ATP-dependent RNA helicase DDX10/DBP4
MVQDVASYIHRVGRTARNESKGKSLLLLTESETHMTELIKEGRVPIKKIQMNKSKNQPLQEKLAQQIAQDAALKHMAQKAFVSYLRSVHLQGNKKVFDISKYPPEGIASAWGLATQPRLRFVDVPDQKVKNIPYALREDGGGKGDRSAAAWAQAEGAEGAAHGDAAHQTKTEQKKRKPAARSGKEEGESDSDGGKSGEAEGGDVEGGGQRRAIATAQPQSKLTKLFNRKNHDVLSETYRKLHGVYVVCVGVGERSCARKRERASERE